MRIMQLGKRRRSLPAHVVASSDEPARPEGAVGAERELASRENDGLHIVLLWDPRDDAVAISVADRREGHRIRFRVEASRALDAFRHPFAYAP
jgi:hypothetical protein